MSRFQSVRWVLSALAFAGALLAGSGATLLGACGPFTDVAADAFCPLVLEVFYLGITTGTTPASYDPAGNVTRLQMAAFLSRSVDGVLRRGSRRAAIGRFWTSGAELSLGITTLAGTPFNVRTDGEDVWVANGDGADTVSRVHGSNGAILGTWTEAVNPGGLLCAMGQVFATGVAVSRLYRIDPSRPPGAVEVVASTLGSNSRALTFDGVKIWTANGASVSIVTPASAPPWPVTTVSTGFANPGGILFDGSNVWASDVLANTILKLDGGGAILQTVTVGTNPTLPSFDGTNIWVPNFNSNSVSVVRASSGAVLATLTGNGLNGPIETAFDGQRVLVTNNKPGADSVSLFKAADFSIVGVFPTGAGTAPGAATSDGLNFWITLQGTKKLARF